MSCEKNEIMLNPLFLFEETGEDDNGIIVGKLERKGELRHGDKLKAAGLS